MVLRFASIPAVLGALAIGPLGLSACAVSTDAPLFFAADATPRPMAQGRWAMTGPGCDVSPGAGAKLPECAVAMSIKDGSWIIDSSSAVPGSMALGFAAMRGRLGLSDVYSCLVVGGEPSIVQCQTKTPDFSARPLQGQLADDRPPTTKTIYSYSALKPLQYDQKGQIIKAVLWIIPCPDAPSAPGFKSKAGGLSLSCVPDGPEAVRSQAPHMRPLQSVFLVWVAQ